EPQARPPGCYAGTGARLLLLEFLDAFADGLGVDLGLPVHRVHAARGDAVARAALEVHLQLARLLGRRLRDACRGETDGDHVLARLDRVGLAHVARALAVDLRDRGRHLLLD